MYALYKKELSVFFSSAIGYLVIAAFLLGNAIMLWLIPDDNLLDYGYADLGMFFKNAPYIFILFIPSLTMRMFADEKSTGTIELLFTKPLGEFSIVLGKYLAALTLVAFALLLTLIYPFSLWQLGNPVGNLDTGAVAGSYLGLLFLASIYVAVGIFASALTPKQITANLIGIAICGFITLGFSALAGLAGLGFADLFLIELGVQAHYGSISRGVIDSRDLLYFLGTTLMFLLAAYTVLRKRKW
jgi:ABC-2 type transport system permease protein